MWREQHKNGWGYNVCKIAQERCRTQERRATVNDCQAYNPHLLLKKTFSQLKEMCGTFPRQGLINIFPLWRWGPNKVAERGEMRMWGKKLRVISRIKKMSTPLKIETNFVDFSQWRSEKSGGKTYINLENSIIRISFYNSL